MDKRQKEVLQAQLNNEKRTLNEIKQVYQQAIKDCSLNISMLSARTDMENIQSIIYQKQYQQAIKAQLETALAQLQSGEFAKISDYLTQCYHNGYIGTMYDIAGQGIPLIVPINQKDVLNAIQIDSKLSKSLYDRLGEDVNKLKTSVRAEVSRGIANGSSWNEIGVRISKGMNSTIDMFGFNKAMNNSIRIARTEGHRIQNQSALDAQNEAKKKGADIVKQWDASLDGRTRDTHRKLDGQLREIDEDFEVDGMRASAPGMFGDPAEDCNCRCALLQRAKWALDEKELDTLKQRAEYFGLDKTKDFEDFKEKYLNVTRGLGATIGGNGIPEHNEPKLIKKLDFSDDKAIEKEISTFEKDAVGKSIETACVITKEGEVYYCYGVEDRVFPDYDLSEKLFGAIISHNHPMKETSFTFSVDDLQLFMHYNLDTLRGCDEKYIYEFTRDASQIDITPDDWMNFENFEHSRIIEMARKYGIGYKRWLNE